MYFKHTWLSTLEKISAFFRGLVALFSDLDVARLRDVVGALNKCIALLCRIHACFEADLHGAVPSVADYSGDNQ